MGISKKEVLLSTAVDIGKLYAFLAQALRVVIEPEAANGISEVLFNEQLDKIRADLDPKLSKNRIVRKNIAEIHQDVTKIRIAASTEATRMSAVKDARNYLPTVEERSRTVSDLVALFRSL
ncbi:MAG: hypothetical protein ABGX83_03425 [Nitrospira sp.]|nr:hypothetical protein [Candidatus Manganitrophaceae bacterium]HIL34290.1 hypothetical protein [Candidatus Manganitrophaceae bacterium]